MSKHKEIIFETEITSYLTHHDWIEGTSPGYDQAITLLKERRTALISAAGDGED